MENESARLPLRIVVSDDLERSRLTVFFRLLLAIPHLVLVLLWGIAALLVAVVVWFALLLRGTAPPSLQAFIASYVRYSIQVSAYLYLAAGPYPPFGGGDGYPVDLEIDVSPRQPRAEVAARLVLVLPALAIASLLGGRSWFGDLPFFFSRSDEGGWSVRWSVTGIAVTAAFLAWFASLVRGRTPQGLRDLVTYCLGYMAQTLGYLLLVTGTYPTSDPARVLPSAALPPHPVRLELTDRVERSRLTVFFRLLLAIPHLIWLSLWSVILFPAVVIAWFAALLTGRVPSAFHRFIAAWVRYATHVGAFLFVIGGPFPGFVGAAGSYPVDLAIDPPARQRRAVTLFRIWLAIPALLVAGAYAGLFWLAGVLGWWAALVTGRMPEGLRNLGAVGLRYSAQANAYVFLLTDRYPYSAPAVRDRPRPELSELPEQPELPEPPEQAEPPLRPDGVAGIEPA